MPHLRVLCMMHDNRIFALTSFPEFRHPPDRNGNAALEPLRIAGQMAAEELLLLFLTMPKYRLLCVTFCSAYWTT